MSPPAPQLRVIPGGSLGEPTETELLRAFSAGDSAAFGQLIKRHQETVFKVVRRYARSNDDARDLAQRAFLQAFEAAERALPRLAAEGADVPFKAWVLRIAVNLGKNHVRDARRWTLTAVAALERCQATARLLGLAALPPLTQTERLVLNGLSTGTQQVWIAQRRRGDGLRRGAGLVLAAGLGALIASALLGRPEPILSAPIVRTVMVTAPEIPVLDFEEANLSDDEVFFEVGWPSPTEGDL